jgi:hypothetical protein
MPDVAEHENTMPPSPLFCVTGKVARSGFTIDNTQRAFDVDVSQYCGVPLQLIRLCCFYPSDNARLTRTPVPNMGKHVAVYGDLIRFVNTRWLIRVRDIAFGPGDIVSPTSEIPPSSSKPHFDWKKKKDHKKARHDDVDDDEDGKQASSSKQTSAKKDHKRARHDDVDDDEDGKQPSSSKPMSA